MSCCGNKREQWSRTEKQVLARATTLDAENPSGQAENDRLEKDMPNKRNEPKIFEYVGPASLALIGASTRSVYHFDFPGHRLEIAYEDSFAIMAEAELKRV